MAAQEDAVFHGDPHAGNLLYNNRTGELTIIDWALRERLSREQRRHLALLFLMVSLRDPVGTCNEVLALSQQHIRSDFAAGTDGWGDRSRIFLTSCRQRICPAAWMRCVLLERVALKGVRFPAPLIMLSKVMFTLDGILGDIGGPDSGMGFAIARHVAQHWITQSQSVPFASEDAGLGHAAVQRTALYRKVVAAVRTGDLGSAAAGGFNDPSGDGGDVETGFVRQNFSLTAKVHVHKNRFSVRLSRALSKLLILSKNH